MFKAEGILLNVPTDEKSLIEMALHDGSAFVTIFRKVYGEICRFTGIDQFQSNSRLEYCNVTGTRTVEPCVISR